MSKTFFDLRCVFDPRTCTLTSRSFGSALFGLVSRGNQMNNTSLGHPQFLRHAHMGMTFYSGMG